MIFKIVVASMALIEARSEDEAARSFDDANGNFDLEDFARSMDVGDSIGASTIVSVRQVEPSGVEDELLQLGNDGTFFDDLPESYEVDEKDQRTC